MHANNSHLWFATWLILSVQLQVWVCPQTLPGGCMWFSALHISIHLLAIASLATKVFIGKLPTIRGLGVWVIIG